MFTQSYQSSIERGDQGKIIAMTFILKAVDSTQLFALNALV